ncbi:MAG: hypothetical protein AAF063_25205 [Cyanobacteria bacterium J06643_5]
MTNYQVVTKWIVSPDGTVVAQAKSVAASVGDKMETKQQVSVDMSSDGWRKSSSSSSSSSSRAACKYV